LRAEFSEKESFLTTLLQTEVLLPAMPLTELEVEKEKLEGLLRENERYSHHCLLYHARISRS